MRRVHLAPVVGLVAGLLLCAALAGTVRLGTSGWVVGIVATMATNALLALAIRRVDVNRFGPADWVTLARVVLACGIAAGSITAPGRPGTILALTGLTTIALVLDAVDGRVARRTRTTSAFGARFDGEADAFLILVLSTSVARATWTWVLAIGAARYAFLVAGWLLPQLRATLPPRYWRKVVAVVQGVTLAVAGSGLAPIWLAGLLLVGAAALLAESFGRDVLWLWRRGNVVADDTPGTPGTPNRQPVRVG